MMNLAYGISYHSFSRVTDTGPRRPPTRTALTPFDLMLTDIKMPGASGIDLARKVKSDNHKLAERIIFMSGDVMEPNIQKFAGGENAMVITKPFDIKPLLSHIKSICDKDELATAETGRPGI